MESEHHCRQGPPGRRVGPATAGPATWATDPHGYIIALAPLASVASNPTAMAHPKQYPRCVFCGARANSREHAVPAWIARRLGIREFLPVDTAYIVGLARRKQPISFASHRARIFCSDCNKHFKHLEDAVIPFLVPMATGRVVSLDGERQALLALWAAKTAVALIAASAPELGEVVPLEHRQTIRVDGMAPADTWIGFFTWRGGPVLAGGIGTAEHPLSPLNRYDAHMGVLTFGQVGFYVVGFAQSLHPGDAFLNDREPMIRFWPPRPGLVHWPPVVRPLSPGADFEGLLNGLPLRGSR